MRHDHLIAAAKAFWLRRSSQVMLVFSLLSMVWGIISGIMLTRDYAQSTRLLGYMALFLAQSALFRLWLEYARRAEQRSAVASAKSEGRLLTFMLERPALVEGAALFVTQVAVQYIVMFCLPLLFFAQAWICLGFAAALAVISLVDPWWSYFAKRPLCMAAARSFSAVLAASFCFAIFFPTYLGYFYPCLAVVAGVSSLPWNLLLDRRRRVFSDWLPCLTIGFLALVSAQAGVYLRVPLLSVWLKDSGFGLGVRDHQLVSPWHKKEPRVRLLLALATDEGVCCFTPVVSPSGVNVPVSHEWAIDGRVIDRIQLSAIRGVGKAEGKAFRTFSCKHHLSGSDTAHTLSCRVFLDGGIYLGRAVVSFE